jgi:putative ABC transport system permease protein
MRVAVRRGRSFGPEDAREATAVCIVNEALVRKYFGRDDAVGQRIRFAVPPPGNGWLTIVGVAADEERIDVRQELGWVKAPIVYLPITQRPAPAAQLLVRPRSALESATIQGIVRQAERGMLLGPPQRLDAVIAEYFRYPSFRAAVLTAFAGVALLLAAVGLYAVLAQAVAQRTRDIGIRIALGASRRAVIVATLKEGMLLTTAGVGAGLVLILPLKRFLSGLLYDVDPGNGAVLVSVAALLIAAGACASYLPARHASRVDPLVALRGD